MAISSENLADAGTLKQLAALDSVRSSWRKELTACDQYLNGTQPMSFLSDEMRTEFGDSITELVIGYPQLVTDSFENRLDVEGFRFPGEPSGSSELWDVWQANDMDAQSTMGMYDALGLGRSAVIVGAGDSPGDAPIISVDSAYDVSWTRDARSRRITSGLKRWTDGDKVEWANIYLPDRTMTLRRGKSGMVIDRVDEHQMGRVPLVPLVNRPRIKFPDGTSEFANITRLVDAANKMATDMMVSGEYHAMPRRWAFGLNRDDFINPDGSAKTAWQVVKGRIWASEDTNVKVGQFDEADLANFHNTIKLIAALICQTAALPPHYLGFAGQNPTSADALRSAEAQFVKRIERKLVHFGDSWEEVMRMVLLIQTGTLPDGADRLETAWRDPATPTIAQKYDAVVKAVSVRGADGRPLVPTEQGRIDLGYSPEQREEMLNMEKDSMSLDPAAVAFTQLANDPTNGDG